MTRTTASVALLMMLGSSSLVACSPKAADTGSGGDEGGSSGSGSGSGTGSGTGDEGCFANPPQIEIGTGDREFEPLAEGDGVMMVHGPQGGWHMLGSVQITNLSEIVSVHFLIIHSESGVVVADNTYRVATIYDEASCSGYYPGMYGYIYVEDLIEGEADTPPELLSYDVVSFCMEVTDQESRVVSDCMDIVATPDPEDIEDGLAE